MKDVHLKVSCKIEENIKFHDILMNLMIKRLEGIFRDGFVKV